MDPLESLKQLESAWRREPAVAEDDAPVSRDQLADKGFALEGENNGE